MNFAVFEVDSAYHVSERRYQRLLQAITDNVDIVTTSVNDLDHCPEVAPVVAIHCKAFNLKPVIFSRREGWKPAPRDQHLVLPKGFSSGEILATMQPYEHALMHHSPLDDSVRVQGWVPVLQEHVSLHEIR